MSDQILSRDNVRLGATAVNKADALAQCGQLLVELGAVTQEYADALFDRERQVSTYLGEGVAIPHGTNESRQYIRRTCLAVLQFPAGVDWDGNTVHLAIAIASNSDEHAEILGNLAEVLMDSDAVAELASTNSVERVLTLLTGQEA